MKITHNITLSVSKEQQAEFGNAGVELGLGFQNFQIDETDPRWPYLKSIVDKHNAVDTLRTHFTASEYKTAEYLALLPSWHFGYPMPDEDFGFLEDFDLTDYCSVCGIGLKQIRPFRIDREPKWGRRSIGQLNWIFDEYFVKPDVWRYIFQPYGIGYRSVLKYRDETELHSVQQLRIEEFVSLELDGFGTTTALTVIARSIIQ